MGAKYVFNPLTGNLDTTDVVAFNGEVDLGTAAAPSIFFTGDPNTGIYSPGADQVAISTGGTGSLFIDSSGEISTQTNGVIRTNSSAGSLTLFGGSTNQGGKIVLNGGNVDGNIIFYAQQLTATPTERARIDSSGRLLVGTSSASSVAKCQVQGNTNNASGGGVVHVHMGTNTPADNDNLAHIWFGDSGSAHSAAITATRDGGTWTTGSSLPTRLAFSTTADGASSPTERMRIKNDGTINFSNVAVYADNAAAKTGGLVDGDVYRTSTGDLKIVYT